jgi:hypothetical protein
MKSTIQSNIMRRVYYSYALSFVTRSVLWQGFLLGACIAAFGRLTHVASIADNLSHTSLTNLPTYIFNTFINAIEGGELLTVLVVVCVLILSAMLAKQLINCLYSKQENTKRLAF